MSRGWTQKNTTSPFIDEKAAHLRQRRHAADRLMLHRFVFIKCRIERKEVLFIEPILCAHQ